MGGAGDAAGAAFGSVLGSDFAVVVTGAGLTEAWGLTEVSMVAITCPTFTVSPSAHNQVNLPASSALSVNVALSESISAYTSSLSTVSSFARTKRAIVTSVMDSPGLGTFKSICAIGYTFNGDGV